VSDTYIAKLLGKYHFINNNNHAYLLSGLAFVAWTLPYGINAITYEENKVATTTTPQRHARNYSPYHLCRRVSVTTNMVTEEDSYSRRDYRKFCQNFSRKLKKCFNTLIFFSKVRIGVPKIVYCKFCFSCVLGIIEARTSIVYSRNTHWNSWEVV
jgi:hypothetical protein